MPVEDTDDSSPLITVVPTAQTFLLFCLVVFTIFTTSSLIINSSESILCLDKSSTSTGLNVPSPTCKVSSARFIPLICNLLSKCLEK